MKNFVLNPYNFIAQDGEFYLLTAANRFNMVLNREQKEVLVSGDITIEKLLQVFNRSEIDKMIEEECLINREFELESRYSRSRGYFYQLGKLDEFEELKEKHVFLLGAGALGTHMGWGFATLGVGRLTILDCDIVEESNLNRQLLYVKNDIGKRKVEALKEHLLEQNENLQIDIIDKRITCKEDFINVLPEQVDLVVRGIDTPVAVASWVFSVCEEKRIPYVSGGTMGTSTLIGPVYVPDKTPSYKEIILNGMKLYEQESTAQRIFGTGVSSCFAITKVAAELMIDAVKILTKQYDTLEYGGRVELIDLFKRKKQEEQITIEKKFSPEEEKTVILQYLAMSSAIMAVAMWVSTKFPASMAVAYFMIAALGRFMWRGTDRTPYIYSVICGAFMGIENMIGSIILGRLNIFGGDTVFEILSNIQMSVFLITLMMCLHAMLFCGIQTIISRIKRRIMTDIAILS